ncbi:MAG: pyruvate formate-lyase activating enzyme, partial [Deltaproteobacteria bacterium]|nr:pyruvate formate-lyase activating enzyme [Deltaproteobacteria bacterium]
MENRILLLDIGAGTLDILYYERDSGTHYKAVVKSPVLSLAQKAACLPGNLLITGVEMGGGSLSGVLRERAREAQVVMTRSAAATLHHDPERVLSWGI